MKKIISFTLLIILVLNISFFNTSFAISNKKEMLTEKDIKEYNKLLSSFQDKKSLQAELKIFKLQKNLVSSFRNTLSNINNVEKKSKRDFNINNIINKKLIKSNLDIDLTGFKTINLSKKYPELARYNYNDELFNFRLEDNSLFYKKELIKDKYVSQGNNKGEINFKFLGDNLINIAYNFDSIKYLKDLYLNFKRVKFKAQLDDKEYKELCTKLGKNYIKDNGPNLISTLKIMDRKFFRLANKTIEIKNGNTLLENISKELKSKVPIVKFNISEEQIEKVLNVLEKEKLIHVYGHQGASYFFYIDPIVALKVNKILKYNLFPVFTFERYSAWKAGNNAKIKELNDGSFEYRTVKKYKGKIVDAKYIVFDEAAIARTLFKNNNYIFLSLKNVIKFKTRNSVGYISFAGDEFRMKYLDNNINYEGFIPEAILYTIYIKRDFGGAILNMKLLNKDFRKNGEIDFRTIRKENGDFRIYGKVDITQEYIKDITKAFNNKKEEIRLLNMKTPPITNKQQNQKVLNKKYNSVISKTKKIEMNKIYNNLNKIGKLSFDFNFSKRNNNLNYLIDIKDSSLLLINLEGYIKGISKMEDKKIKIKKPTNIYKKFSNLDNFFEYVRIK